MESGGKCRGEEWAGEGDGAGGWGEKVSSQKEYSGQASDSTAFV